MMDIKPLAEKILREIIRTHVLPFLDKWAAEFNTEHVKESLTPRYSQILYRNGVLTLGSTLDELFFYPLVDIPEDDYEFLEDCSDFLTGDLWQIYKDERTKFLTLNYPTIKAF